MLQAGKAVLAKIHCRVIGSRVQIFREAEEPSSYEDFYKKKSRKILYFMYKIVTFRMILPSFDINMPKILILKQCLTPIMFLKVQMCYVYHDKSRKILKSSRGSFQSSDRKRLLIINCLLLWLESNLYRCPFVHKTGTSWHLVAFS